MLSLALAIAAGDAPSGGRSSIGSANGTRTRSVSAPPHAPPAGPIPYIDPRGFTSRQLPVRPRRQASHAPHEIWNGTTARSPGDHPSTSSPASTTSATNSCPSGNGPWKGDWPATIAASRSQVATARGRTSAWRGPSSAGSGTSRHSTLPGSMKVSSRMTRPAPYWVSAAGTRDRVDEHAVAPVRRQAGTRQDRQPAVVVGRVQDHDLDPVVRQERAQPHRVGRGVGRGLGDPAELAAVAG